MAPSSRRTFLSGIGLATVSGLAGCAGFTGPTAVENSTQTYSSGDYDAVAVENRNGDVRLEPGASGDDLTVEIRKRGRTQAALDDVTVESTVDDGVITIESVYENQFSGVSVRLVVSVPEGVTVRSVSTGNGDVLADGVTGDATLSTGNGDAEAVDVDGYVTVESGNGEAVARGTTGIAGGSSGNGDVEVEVFALREDVSLTTGNGEVEAGVAADLDADVVLSVGNGDIEEDVDLADRSGGRNRVTGRLGDGGPQLTLSSGNGDVRLYGLEE